jgi:serine/threonine protein kinase
VKALEAGDPAQIGKYRLLGRLGSGGMVFLGQSPGGRLVAVKLIRPDLAADIDFRVRFSREVKAARKVSGIFTAPVVDADPDGPQPWLVTAYVPGPSLADAVRAEGPLPVSSVLMLAAGLTEGISALHAAGVVHRDLKPSNVLLASDGPRIIDFGVSWAADATPVTSAGMVIGSPAFMSLEQAGGYEVGPASDVFSLGSVLTFAATGEGPFGTGPGTVLLYRVQHLEPAIDRLPQAMTAGYRTTARDVVTSLTTKGTAVSGTIHAYQTTGALKTYQVHFVVRNGVITAGHQTLLGISYPSAGASAVG